VFVGNVLGFLFLALIPWVIYGAIVYAQISIPQFITFNAEKILGIFYVIWLLAIWLRFFIVWTNYYLDVWYVTEKRIIDVDQKALFNREVSNLRFDRIQDVTLQVRGVVATFLDYGDIRVQTAAEDSTDFYMEQVAHPERVKQVIFAQHNRAGNISEDKEIGI
jgi:hypothetical protein